MKRMFGSMLWVVLAAGLAGCDRPQQMESGGSAPLDSIAVTGSRVRQAPGEMAAADAAMAREESQSANARDGDADVGAMLAYEHNATVEIDADAIPERLQAARSACESRKFGACVVLNVQQNGGDHPSAMLGMRIVPAGVEPMITLASDGARLGSRSTHAEDLAVVVRDNAQVQERLRNELARLQEFQQRRDLAVADMIALSQRIAEAEAQLQYAQQEGAQHKRRIDTQLLTLHFQPTGGQEGRSEIGQALRDFGKTLSMGAAWTIRAAAFLIPLVLVLFILVVVVRRMRRRNA